MRRMTHSLCVLVLILIHFFFFFQAEDGIRDVAVTGVQTCALPISLVASLRLRLNSLIPCPNEDPISGIRFAPKTSTSTSSRIRMWLNDRSPNITRLASKDRSGDVVRDRHSHEREQGYVDSDRPESDRHHQQVHVDRPQRGGQDRKSVV